MRKRTRDIFDTFVIRHPQFTKNSGDILQAVDNMVSCYHLGGKVIVCGNGGSASDCEHIVGELMKSFRLHRPIDSSLREQLIASFQEMGAIIADNLQTPVPAISLTTHTALMTALCNDNDPAMLFAQQAFGYCRKNDIFIAVSTSGNSKNVVYAAMVAQTLGAKVLALTGQDGGKLAQLADVVIKVPAKETFAIQELHLPVYHVVCLMVESELFDE